MVLIPIVFVIPNVFGHNVILPALRSVSGVGSKVDTVAPHISQWHGVNLPLILSVIVCGNTFSTYSQLEVYYAQSD